MGISERSENADWIKLEKDEERLREDLAYITKNHDLDLHIPGAKTWATWKSRLLSEVAKKSHKLRAHLKDSIATEDASVRFESSIMHWVD